MSELKLEDHEIQLAVEQANRLSRIAASRGIPNQFGYQANAETDLAIRTMHSGAVLLCRKFLGIDMSFPREVNLQAPDILPDIKVHWTPNQNGGLIVRQNNNRLLKLLLVTGQDMESLAIRGWAWVADVRERGFRLQKPNRPDCWVLPQRQLQPMHTIRGGQDV